MLKEYLDHRLPRDRLSSSTRRSHYEFLYVNGNFGTDGGFALMRFKADTVGGSITANIYSDVIGYDGSRIYTRMAWAG
jgi:hypothetical protein